MATRSSRSRFRGCLLGGAVGDALGAPVEFLSLDEIRERFGPAGVTDLAPAYGRIGAITDDTQMTMFTAEGLLRAQARWESRGICHVPGVVYHAYVRWLYTQGFESSASFRPPFDGWLVGLEALHRRRAPGRTCVSALQAGTAGSRDKPINGSKGCGGVMRVAPVGLLAANPFELGSETAALTHGHPTGYLAAGCLALLVRRLAGGETLAEALEVAREALRSQPHHEECTAALDRAVAAAASSPVSAETVERIGLGWVAEEALAIAVYCAVVVGIDFAKGVLLAVNHSGDSDSTGAIAGNILGTMLGEDAIPRRWLEQLELRDEIAALADDLAVGYRDDEAWGARYPGW